MTKILLVEDDNDLVIEMKTLLISKGHILEAVHTLQAAEDFVAVSTFDLIVLDFNLPDGDGTNLIGYLRQRKLSTPVLMLTKRTSLNDKVSGFEAGADDYLTKPFYPAELLCRIDALLRRPAVVLGTSLRYGDLELDLRARVAKQSGSAIVLTPREFALLEFFMRHPQDFFSLEALLQRVWEAQSEATAETVMSTIRRLRKKIDRDGEPSFIRNLYGAGYGLRKNDG